MNVYTSLRAALKQAITIKLGDEIYHIDCYDHKSDEVRLSNDADEFTITVDEMIAVYGTNIQMWEIVPLAYEG